MKAAIGLRVPRLYTSHFTHTNSLRVIVSPMLLFLEVNQILSVVNKQGARPPTFLYLHNTWSFLIDIFHLAREIRDEKCCPTVGKNISI